MTETVYCHDNKLKPCAHCGGEAQLVARRSRRGWIGFVQCGTCELQTRVFPLDGELDAETFDDDAFTRAVARWQQREKVVNAR